MVQSLDTIKKPIVAELIAFQSKFKLAMSSPVPLLEKITYYIVKRKGKQVRPMFVFLCAKLCGEVTESSYHAASLVEILHTATLVHDDVVDDADKRRGFFSINALWKNKIAVLCGDYLLSKGLLLAIDNNEIEKARRLDIKEDIYYDIIKGKTASLISAACAAGAASTTDDKEVIDKVREFGELIGISFQIKDDLFDFGDSDVGKPLGIDIKEKKMTLPLIYALENASWTQKRKIINIIKNHNTNKKKVQEVIQFVRASGGIEYATQAMYDYRDRAFALLNTFPESPSKTSLEELVRYVTERKK